MSLRNRGNYSGITTWLWTRSLQLAIAAAGLMVAILAMLGLHWLAKDDPSDLMVADTDVETAVEASSTDSGAIARYVEVLRDGYSPCGEILRIHATGEESGDLRELGFMEPITGLPEVNKASFQHCSADGITGDAALAFLINDEYVLLISNSQAEWSNMVRKLDLHHAISELSLHESPALDTDIRATLHPIDPSAEPYIPGSAPHSIDELITDGRN